MPEKIILFVENFFKNLGSNLCWRGEILEVSNIPSNFEKFYGKKGPYLFSVNKIENREDIDHITSSSFLVGCIKDFLETKGQTTHLRIIPQQDIREQILNNFFFKNCKIETIAKEELRDYLLRFNFQTTFQYLNLKEHINKEFYFYKGEKVRFNLEDYNIAEGNNKELELSSIKKEYAEAKEEVKKSLASHIEKISLILDKKLDKELVRIKEHFSNQFREIREKMEALDRDLKNVDKNNPFKLDKIKKAIGELGDPETEAKLRREEEFIINDEKNKHALNISTRLLNTTIISFPIEKLKVHLSSNNTSGIFDLDYNPLTEKFSKVFCSSCKNEIKILNLCSSGHVSCDKCFRGCANCGKDYCNSCLERICFSCGKRLCRRCSRKCIRCGKYKCPSHFSSSICESCRNR